jgi:F0F1-type ATP synthase assembly protein I
MLSKPLEEALRFAAQETGPLGVVLGIAFALVGFSAGVTVAWDALKVCTTVNSPSGPLEVCTLAGASDPRVGEFVGFCVLAALVFAGAVVGALIGFAWEQVKRRAAGG